LATFFFRVDLDFVLRDLDFDLLLLFLVDLDFVLRDLDFDFDFVLRRPGTPGGAGTQRLTPEVAFLTYHMRPSRPTLRVAGRMAWAQ